jgi:hypothetical protein
MITTTVSVGLTQLPAEGVPRGEEAIMNARCFMTITYLLNSFSSTGASGIGGLLPNKTFQHCLRKQNS